MKCVRRKENDLSHPNHLNWTERNCMSNWLIYWVKISWEIAKSHSIVAWLQINLFWCWHFSLLLRLRGDLFRRKKVSMTMNECNSNGSVYQIWILNLPVVRISDSHDVLRCVIVNASIRAYDGTDNSSSGCQSVKCMDKNG